MTIALRDNTQRRHTLRAKNAFERRYIAKMNLAINNLFIFTTCHRNNFISGFDALVGGISKETDKTKVLDIFKNKLKHDLITWEYLIVFTGTNKCTGNIDYVFEAGRVEATYSTEIGNVANSRRAELEKEVKELLTGVNWFYVTAPNCTNDWEKSVNGFLDYMVKSGELNVKKGLEDLKLDVKDSLEFDFDEALEWKRLTESSTTFSLAI